ncbi:hypothetical protein HZS_7738 [Henneguya salminicola]|nr:hypothetical protein HZS_7738 [Henneguya salminicola]
MMMENSNTTDEIQSENETTEEILNQNIYYTSKLLIQTNPTKALECFKENKARKSYHLMNKIESLDKFYSSLAVILD